MVLHGLALKKKQTLFLGPLLPPSSVGLSGEKLLAHERASAGAVRAKLFEQMETERNQLVAQALEVVATLTAKFDEHDDRHYFSFGFLANFPAEQCVMGMDQHISSRGNSKLLARWRFHFCVVLSPCLVRMRSTFTDMS